MCTVVSDLQARSDVEAEASAVHFPAASTPVVPKRSRDGVGAIGRTGEGAHGEKLPYLPRRWRIHERSATGAITRVDKNRPAAVQA